MVRARARWEIFWARTLRWRRRTRCTAAWINCLPHKEALFRHLRQRWQDLFGAKFEVLLYDLTSTYFESDPPADEADKRRYGYSRDKRSDCVQVVIALIVTPEGFPLAYEVMAGNTADNTTLRGFLAKIEALYGKAERIWVMDRGIPTEEVLAEMRQADPPVSYLVGTPKGRLTKLEQALLGLPWQEVRDGVEVKLLPQDDELYVFAQSHARINKERAMRRRQLKRLWARLEQMPRCGSNARIADEAWCGASQGAGGLAAPRRRHRPRRRRSAIGSTARSCGRRAGAKAVICCAPICPKDPAQLWQLYIQLVEVEAAFKNLKDDLGLRPIYHQLEQRIEAHIFIAFMAYCLHVTSRQTASARRRAHPASRARQVCRHPDARRPLPNHRRPHADLDPLHRAQRRPKPPRPTQSDPAAATSPAHHRSRPIAPHPTRVVETF